MFSSSQNPGDSGAAANISSPEVSTTASSAIKEKNLADSQVLVSASAIKKEDLADSPAFSLTGTQISCHSGLCNNLISVIDLQALFCALHENAARGVQEMAAKNQKTRELAALQQARRKNANFFFSGKPITQRHAPKKLTGAALEAGRRHVEANKNTYKAPTMKPVIPDFVEALTGGHKINIRKRSPVDVARLDTARTFNTQANTIIPPRRRQLSSCSSSSADSALLAPLSPTRKHAREDSSGDGDNEASSGNASDAPDTPASTTQESPYKGDFLSRRMATTQRIAKKQRRT